MECIGDELWPFMPLPSSWKVLREEPCSSVCSLPEEATLLWGERGAWSVGMKVCRPPWSSWLTHSEPHAWGLEGIMDMGFFIGLGCICTPRPGKRRDSGVRNITKQLNVLKRECVSILDSTISKPKTNSLLNKMLIYVHNIPPKPPLYPLYVFSLL